MATVSELSNQLSEVSQYQNQDIKIYVSSVDYSTLDYLYHRDKNKYNDAINNDISNSASMDVWRNSLAKTFMICAYGQLKRDENEENPYWMDQGKYELVAFAPDGRPIRLTPAFSDIDGNTYLRIREGKDKNDNNFTYLQIDLRGLSNWIADDPNSGTYQKIENTYAYLWNSYANLHSYTLDLSKRINAIEAALKNNIVWRSNNSSASYLWTGTYDQYKAITPTDSTAYMVKRS